MGEAQTGIAKKGSVLTSNKTTAQLN